tara:strand:+ start:49740 stop:50597 length:858 start_codon:yes stop_codon:yes gene_type:complete
MKPIFKLIIVIFLMSCNDNRTNEEYIPLADEFLLTDYTPVQVMLIGTWHFNYPNADSYKVDSANMIDLSNSERQVEIMEVVEKFSAFNPTIICIEIPVEKQPELDSLYERYVSGDHDLSMSEQQQLGFRIAQKSQAKVFAVDSYSWLREHSSYEGLHDIWDEKYYLDTLESSKWWKKYSSWYEFENKLLFEHTVMEKLKIMNHPINLKRSLGHYLVELKTSNHNGPDSFSLKWYNRNVRIFNNILKTNPKEGDKILVIYGASHVSILEQLFDASPQFELVRPFEY